MAPSNPHIEKAERYGAKNYHPLPIVIASAEGIHVTDTDGKRYIDMLSAYSALNAGHCHPRIIRALKEQADRVTLTSRAFHHDQLGDFYEKLSALTGKGMILPMNTGAEAVRPRLRQRVAMLTGRKVFRQIRPKSSSARAISTAERSRLPPSPRPANTARTSVRLRRDSKSFPMATLRRWSRRFRRIRPLFSWSRSKANPASSFRLTDT